MPQLTSVVLKNHAAVDQTFAPRGIVNGVASLAKSTGVPIGDLRITASRSRTQTGREKVTFKLQLPVVQDVTVSGISKPTAVRTAFCDIAFTVDSTSNTPERQDLLAFAKNLLGSTLASTTVVDLEDIY